ncbi:MAG TPA: 2,3-bisphosphoglycerate-dependent phosphoglycerate mutase [Flavobacteriales bacterium]|nr:2,3-bisphosphoglycerate-dependent phosphoglycerate mutase [Flavobacteriales bacterium]
MSKLVIVRHGQSQWNKENRFTGWIDVDLAEKGVEEAINAGKRLKGFSFDYAFTSALIRAQRTLDLILEQIEQTDLPVKKDQALNERMYGDLQGTNKDEAREQFGEKQVHIWRRSFDIAPPNGESLKDTADRVLPYFEKEIVPLLKQGKNVLIAAHGNSLRALIMSLEKLDKDEILKVEVPTGEPKIYELDADLNILSSNYLN